MRRIIAFHPHPRHRLAFHRPEHVFDLAGPEHAQFYFRARGNAFFRLNRGDDSRARERENRIAHVQARRDRAHVLVGGRQAGDAGAGGTR